MSLAACTRNSNDSASTSTTENTTASTTTTSRLSIEERVEQAADAVATQRGLAETEWFDAVQAMCKETSSSRIPMLYEEFVNRLLSTGGDPTITHNVLQATIAGMKVYCPTQGQLMEDAYRS